MKHHWILYQTGKTVEQNWLFRSFRLQWHKQISSHIFNPTNPQCSCNNKPLSRPQDPFPKSIILLRDTQCLHILISSNSSIHFTMAYRPMGLWHSPRLHNYILLWGRSHLSPKWTPINWVQERLPVDHQISSRRWKTSETNCMTLAASRTRMNLLKVKCNGNGGSQLFRNRSQ